MTYILTVSGTFSAAHSILSFPKGHKCKNIHGHTWEVECNFKYNNTLKNQGICCDFHILKSRLNSIISQLDHTNLNDKFDISSAENIAKYIYNHLVSDTNIKSVKVKESQNAWVVYSEDI